MFSWRTILIVVPVSVVTVYALVGLFTAWDWIERTRRLLPIAREVDQARREIDRLGGDAAAQVVALAGSDRRAIRRLP